MRKLSKEIQAQVLEKLEKDIISAQFPPSFEADFKEFSIFGSNCLSYALQLKTDYEELQNLDPNMEYPYDLWFLSGIEQNYQREGLIEAFFRVCELLNIDCKISGIEDAMSLGEYKIAIMKSLYRKFFTGEYDYHFARENANNIWTEKLGPDGTPRKLHSPPNIYSGYELVGIVKVKKKLSNLTNF